MIFRNEDCQADEFSSPVIFSETIFSKSACCRSSFEVTLRVALNSSPGNVRDFSTCR